LSLSWSRPIQSISPYYTSKIHLNIIHPPGLFPSGFPINNLYAILFPHSFYMTHPFHSRLDHFDCTCWRIKVTKFLVMQTSPPYCHFVPLRSKYSPQHLVLKRSQSILP
jgi:hypothetical protein